jgi:DivIVA domain-containing protein
MLTPEEIQAREFLVSLRGYDRDEVHSFLEQVAGQIRDLQRRLEGQPPIQPAEATPVSELVPSSQPPADPKPFFEDLGQTTQRIVEAAYESAAEIQRRARSRADRELVEARNQAAKAVAEGERRREVIEGLVEMLEERRAALAEDLRGIARTVDQMLTDFALPGDMPAAYSNMPVFDDQLAVAEITASDENSVSEDDDLAEGKLVTDTDTEDSESAPVTQPVAEVTELAEADSERAPSCDDDDDDAVDSPEEHAAQTAGSVLPDPLTVGR